MIFHKHYIYSFPHPSQEDYPQVSSHTGTSQDSRPCDGVHISDPTTNLNPDGKLELPSTYDSDSLAQLNIDLFQSIYKSFQIHSTYEVISRKYVIQFYSSGGNPMKS